MRRAERLLSGLPGPGFEFDGHCRKAAKPHASSARWLAIDAISRKALHEPTDRDTGFEPRERQPRALMDAEAEREMPVRRAANIEAVRLRKLFRVAIGRADAQRDRRAPRDCDATDRGVDARHAVAELIRTLEAQALLHRRVDQRRLAQQRSPLLGPERKRDEAIADEVGRGLVPGVQNENAV